MPVLGNRTWRCTYFGSLASAVWLCAAVALAQPADPADVPAAGAAAEAAEEADAADAATSQPDATDREPPVSPLFERLQGKVERVGPDTFLLLDEQGNPQPVLNMQIEEFLAAWRNQQKLLDEAETTEPDHTLNELRMVGSLEPGHALLQVTLDITLHESGSVEVPLGLAGTILHRQPEAPTRSDGRFLSHDAEQGGWLVTLTGEPGQQVRVVLDLVAPVRRDGNRSTLRLLAPRANKSSLVLVSQSAIQSVVANEGVVLSTSTLLAGGMRVEAEGVAGEFALSWEDRSGENERLESVLGAATKLYATIDERQVRTQARLVVQNFSGSFREFTVRLPPGAQWRNRTDYEEPIERVELIDDLVSAGEEAGSDRQQATELRVTLASDQTGPVTLDLETVQTLNTAAGEVALDLTGFEVVGAVPQDGEIGIRVADNWQLGWQPHDSVQPIDPSDLDLSWQSSQLTPDDLTAAFRYFRHPWSLPVRLTPRQQRIEATPTYRLTITGDEALLEMDVAYRITGVPSLPISFAPRFVLKGWDVRQSTTSNLEEATEIVQLGGAMLAGGDDSPEELRKVVGFENAVATSTRPRVTLQLRQALPDDEFQVQLPYPDHDNLVVNTSELNVEADTSVRLEPQVSPEGGLVPLPIVDGQDSSADRPPGQQFRYRGLYPQLEFAAEREPRPQRLLVASDADIQWQTDQIVVEQLLSFDVRHQPATSLRLAVPRGVSRSSLELELLPPSGSEAADVGMMLDFPDQRVATDDSEATIPEIQVPLPHARRGQFRLRATYVVAPPTRLQASFVLPLLSAPGAELIDQRATLVSELGQNFVPATGSRWRLEGNENGASRARGTVFTTTQDTSFLPLSAAGRITAQNVVEIDRLWLQTWLAGGQMQQRTVFHFRGGDGSVHVELPDDAPDSDQVEVVLDGVVTLDVVASDRSLEVPLPPDASREHHTLELRYRVPAPLAWSQTLRVDRPRLVGNESNATLYWQVVAPLQYNWLSSPRGLIPAFKTGWSEGDWRSQCELQTADLERRVTAAEGMRPAGGEHAFLFRAWHQAPLEATLVRRELLVLGVSTVVLVALLSVVYVPWLRRPPVLIAGLVVLAVVGLAMPQWSALAAQLGLVGLVCGLLGWLLAILGQRSRVRPAAAGSSTLAADASGSQTASTLAPTGGGTASTNAPTVSVELTDSNV